MRITFLDVRGDERSIPAKYEVCSRCDGRGAHDAWDGGMTRDEMDEQGPEFFEDYMRGMYDRRCTVCGGNRVELVADRQNAPEADLAAYDESLMNDYHYKLMIAAERRMGA